MKPIEFSFEFFPPKTEEGVQKLRASRAELRKLSPKFVSVTFGAGGSTQQGTLDTVLEMASEGFEAAPHLSCIGSSKQALRLILAQYRDHGIRHIVALRGDLPSGMGEVGELRYASELVAFIRQEHGDWFNIEVAAYPEFHPQSKSPLADLENFARKVKAGANSAITQYFYNADAYFEFVDEARKLGVDVPIVPGVMPITNFSQLMRFSDMCGAEVPKWVAYRLERFGDDRESIREFGLDVVTGLCRRLVDGGAPGLHFYTLNGAQASKSICERLGLKRAPEN
ncbi:5,10-methylenetetrahydrofolate reductase [Candidatus Burkholderia pumila]|uniref:Methylenetetrahydrofolate reductase n=1 Tax=Candidatus Burkholderia pumila TaxID=1090375 RepID=A0ABR5HJY5_9BURK|nr:5,10-methylenetetrahydrofolate reductase [Candidatus Burkholderia pumila]